MTYEKPKTKKATIADFKERLGTDKAWAIRGLMRIYKEQRAEEKSSHHCLAVNGVGFTKFDADFLSDLAESYKKYNNLTDGQMKHLYRIMPKYAKQLYELTYQSRGKRK